MLLLLLTELVDVVTLRENGPSWQVVRILLVAIATRQEDCNNLHNKGVRIVSKGGRFCRIRKKQTLDYNDI